MKIFAETAIWDEFGRIFYNFTGGGIHIFEDFMGGGVLTRKIVQTSCTSGAVNFITVAKVGTKHIFHY